MNQLLRAVKFLHTEGIVHSRIYISNILLTRDYQLKLIGFEFAHFAFELQSSYFQERLRDYDIEDQAIGTQPNYCSPEFLLDFCRGFSFPMDSWSIGCILAELLIGEKLFFVPRNHWGEVLIDIFGVFGFPSFSQGLSDEEIQQELGIQISPGSIIHLQRNCSGKGKGLHEFMLERRDQMDLSNDNNLNSNNNDREEERNNSDDDDGDFFNPCAVHLLENLLLVNPKFRISPEAALSHPFFADAELPFPYSHDYHDVSFSPIVDQHNINNKKKTMEELFQFMNEESFSEQEMIELLESENS
jgi:serine/threonine protein kinase